MSAQPATQIIRSLIGDVAPASLERERSARTLGALLVDAGRLSAENALRIVERQRSSGERFGEAGLALKLITENDLAFALARQFSMPDPAQAREALDPSLIAALRPVDPVTESLRALRSQLLLRGAPETDGAFGVAVLGSARGEGRSFVAANLAILFAQLGKPTLLVDADLRAPSQHRLFREKAQHGLAGILAGRAGHEEIRPCAAVPLLHLLPAGPTPPNPQDLLARDALAEFFAAAARRFAYVIVDTPPADGASDALLAARAVGGAMVLARPDRTPLRPLQRIASELAAWQVPLHGAMLNRA